MKSNTPKYNIEDMQKLVYDRGGKCLSDEYIKSTTKLKWQCKEKHTWMATPSSVRSNSTWCPYCYGNVKYTIKEIHELAVKRDGKCLSNVYVDANTKLKWQCDKGHTWNSTSNNIRNGSWCPYCAGKAKLTIEEMCQLAENRGGKCLSNVYVNAHTILKWQCNKKHIWKVVPQSIKQGGWCPECRSTIKWTIQKIQKIAESRDGKCLSKIYINSHTKLKWQCKEGHIWEAKPAMIKYKTWCPVCAGRKK